MKRLGEQVRVLTEEAGGKWSVYIENLTDGGDFSLNKDDRHYAASIIKLPILATVFRLADQGSLRLSEPIMIEDEDLVGGAGVLQHLKNGSPYTLYDLAMLMIIQSDNTATNILVDLVGIKTIQQYLKVHGFEGTSFYNKLMIVPAKRKGPNLITAVDMGRLLTEIAQGHMISLQASERMIDILKKQQLQDCLPALLPEQNQSIVGTIPVWEIAHKTGSVQGILHDVGILYVGQRKLVAAILSQGLDKLAAQSVIQKIGLELYRYLKK